MALDFPANPSDGQVYNSYIFSSASGVWKAREESAAPAVVSSVPPATANSGDIWVDSSDGISYVYYNDGSSSQWIEMISSGVVSLETATPTGSVIQTARSTAPTGWLLCEGQAISRTEYSRLFNAIGTAYGSGNGSTTFNVPNLKGRVPVGRDDSQTEFDALGETGGSKTVTLTQAQMPSHSHTTPSHSHTFSGTTSTTGEHVHVSQPQYRLSGGPVQLNGEALAGAPNNGLEGGFNGIRPTNTSAAGNHSHTYSGTTSESSPTTNSSGSGEAHPNLQPYVVLNYIIKV